MRPPNGKRWLSTLAFGLTLGLPAVAAAQQTKSHFGERDSFVVSIERIFGFQGQNLFGQNNDSIGFHPILWGNVGLFAVQSSGLSFGSTVGLAHVRDLTGDDKDSFTVARLGPRIGYAGWLKQGFGYWVRGGPSAMFLFSKQENTDANGQKTTESQNMELFQLSLEAYVVIAPTDHLGILVGPHADIHLFGLASDDVDSDAKKYRSAGLTVGLMGDFW
ncbi:MAG: hypothetical protein KC776_06985 [Myxococcales bacterium]|nr:hypothetical protein [Myxococcales bacterium]